MDGRREFIKKLTGTVTAILAGKNKIFGMTKNDLKSKRPPPEQRKFRSSTIDKFISKCKDHIADVEIAWLFENCFPNTLDTTIRYSLKAGIPDTYVITGDIDAMWLRDSTAQVWPYLRFISNDNELRSMILGVINRQIRCLNIDLYANAFSFEPTDSPWQNDITEMKPEIHERKWELDSICYPIRLINEYYQLTGDISFINADFNNAMEKILFVLNEQKSDKEKASYKFQRITAIATDTLSMGGYGNPSRPCGLINSAFQPSDDACIFSFHIPSNLFAAKVLKEFTFIPEIRKLLNKIAEELKKISDEIIEVISSPTIEVHQGYGEIYAYKIDSLGSKLYMDDANIPSLLSLPYLGITEPTDPVYCATRKFLLSKDISYIFEGKFAAGIRSPHTGMN